ncbi:modifier of mdg4-like isoform X8 [Lucilia sericata]|uniref:modifier of mdg4-like isoform X8 n=1 Tax=Lucilia sericata TaxID=13632 RepID=UPI0018A81304|nr:modifier of mdg4-like isoform X8 [Lucilia sericata]
MADDEQFSLCWNNFNSNLSAGFHESLCRGDLVDVTLAAEGQFVKAHRLVLSVCSPYFRKMFTQMPANQHAFVFLKDVSHTALKDLIQFMYCGEVNVKQEALPAFISTAEALQIKGLTDSDPPQSQTPPEPSTPTPQIQQQQQIQTSPRVRQRTSTARSYKIETVEDSGDDAKQTTQIVIQTTAPTHPPQATITTQPQHQQQHQPQQQQQQHHHQPQQQQHITQQTLHTQTHQLTSVSMPAATTTTVVTQKRPAQRSSLGSVPNIKRSKSTIDPLEASDANTAAATHQINVQTVVAESKPQVQHHHQQQQQHQTHHHHQQQQAQHQQQTNEPEYIDLPIDLPTKSEPDYAEEAGEVDQAEQDATYVEDESYGDMRYDESYFTENEDAAAAGGNATATSTQNTSATTATTSKAIVKQQPLSDSSYMDTSADPANSDAQAAPLVKKPPAPAPAKVPSGKIPLCAGSRVYVAKNDLMKIFIPNACIYTSRLSDLVFGLENLEKVAKSGSKDYLKLLNEDILKSMITHVVQVFTLRGETIDSNVISNTYLRIKMPPLIYNIPPHKGDVLC